MNIWVVIAIITAPAVIYGTALQTYGYVQRRRAARRRTYARDIIARVHAEQLDQADDTAPRRSGQQPAHGLPAGWHWPSRDHDPLPSELRTVGPRPYLVFASRERQQWR